jgi:hypothetical protein
MSLWIGKDWINKITLQRLFNRSVLRTEESPDIVIDDGFPERVTVRPTDERRLHLFHEAIMANDWCKIQGSSCLLSPLPLEEVGKMKALPPILQSLESVIDYHASQNLGEVASNDGPKTNLSKVQRGVVAERARRGF